MATESVEAAWQAELRKKIEYQVACEERAHRIVERLIYNPVTQEHLIDCLHYITSSHYADIVEERAVSKLCGYPLCPNPLGNVPKQKYMISTKTNKVYDIEARKNFCGAKCYKASKHLEIQISDDPLWTRKSMAPRKYDLLSLDMKSGKMGDEVVVSRSKEVRSELDKLEKQEQYFARLAELSKGHESHSQKVSSDVSGSRKSVKNDQEGKEKGSENQNVKQTQGYEHSLETAMDELDIQEKKLSNQASKTADARENYVEVAKTGDAKVTDRDSESYLNVPDNQSKSRNSGAESEITHKGKGKKKSQKDKNDQKAKTDYLMQLLDKRKHLLVKMVDIRNSPVRDFGQTSGIGVKSQREDYLENLLMQEIVHNKGNESNQFVKSENVEVIENQDIYVADESGCVNSGEESVNTGPVYVETVEGKDLQNMDMPSIKEGVKLNEGGTVNQKSSAANSNGVNELGKGKENIDITNSRELQQGKVIEKENVTNKTYPYQTDDHPKSNRSYCRTAKEKQTIKDRKQEQSVTGKMADIKSSDELKPVTTLDLICRQVQTWISDKTRDYLKVEDVASEISVKCDGAKGTGFEKKWEELVAKVDAQEKDFDAILGEQRLDNDWKDRPAAPLPHFDVLRQEVEESQLRVQQFMKGSFTYKVVEKPAGKMSDEGTEVVLPTVDRYDQVLIRRKIVLDRINKVLPDLLSPLHLMIQDVLTELREMIFTFNLTSENILFRPAEWTIVALVLLRMLSRKLSKMERSFRNPGAEKYFFILLTNLGATIDLIDLAVDRMLTI